MRLLRWLPLLSLIVAGALAALVALWVDLKPRVDERFFFANDSKVFRESAALGRRFSNRQLLVVTAHGDDIDSPGLLPPHPGADGKDWSSSSASMA